MRDIRFRGKRVDNGEWVYGSYVKLPSSNHRIYFAHYHKDWSFSILFHEVVPATVGQSTGLKDKNGKDIYENDVVQNQYKAIRYVKRTKYGEYRLFCDKHNSHFVNGWENGIEWEVIGTIHENPVLGGKK